MTLDNLERSLGLQWLYGTAMQLKMAITGVSQLPPYRD